MAAEARLTPDEGGAITQATINASQAFRPCLTFLEQHGERAAAQLLHWRWDRMLRDLQQLLQDAW